MDLIDPEGYFHPAWVLGVSTMSDGSVERNLMPSEDFEVGHSACGACACDPRVMLMAQETPGGTVYLPFFVHRTKVQRLSVPDTLPVLDVYDDPKAESDPGPSWRGCDDDPWGLERGADPSG